MIEPCKPDGHNWVLESKTEINEWYHRAYRSMFRKRVVFETGMFTGIYRLMGYRKQWYCSKCRQWDTEDDMIRTRQDCFEEGLAYRTEDGWEYDERYVK